MRKLPKKIQEAITYHYPGDKFVKRAKYSNRSCSCWSKHLHQSILESDYCNELSLLKKAREIVDYRIQYKMDLTVKGVHITNYYADFLVLKAGGKQEIHETKGYMTEVGKIKLKLSQALNPRIPHIIKYEKPRFFRPIINRKEK